ncbi:MAG: DNA primase [Planctomycetota bacterium]|nr:DNA primase [Planctomycetota bacterium]
MPRISDEITQSVREAVDIVDVISSYVQLKKAGASYKGLCPFHDEKTPSFTVFPQSQRYVCFGCGEKGDAFAFIMRRQNLTFPEAIRELARQAHIEIPETGDDDGRGGARRAAHDAMRFAAAFYAQVLRRPVGAEALSYLKGRGITDATIELFGLGYAPPEWDALLSYARSKGIGDDALLDAGLVRRRDDGRVYDMFRGRIVFPIHDAGGRVVGFGGRAMGDDQPKYLNSADGPIFHKGRELYGLRFAREGAAAAGRVLLVEGYTDVLLLHQAGVREAVASLGTALTPHNARALSRFGVPVIVLYDGDAPGASAAERAAEALLREGPVGSVALLPEGRDPADLMTEEGEHGLDLLERTISGATELFRYLVDRMSERHDLRTVAGRTQAGRALLGAISGTADALQREAAFRLVAAELGLSEEVLRRQLPRPKGAQSRDSGNAIEAASVPISPRWRRAERDFLAAALFLPDLWPEIGAVYPQERFKDPILRELAKAVNLVCKNGQSPTCDAVAGAVGDEAGLIVLGLEEPDRDGREALEERVRSSLERIVAEDRVEAALQSDDPLAAVVAARRADRSEGSEQEQA